MSTQPTKTLSHAEYSYAESVDCIRVGASQHSAAIVLDLQYHLILPSTNVHRRYIAARVTEDVGQSLLYDSKEICLYLERQPADIIIRVQLNLDAAAACEPVDIPSERRNQPNAIQGRWV